MEFRNLAASGDLAFAVIFYIPINALTLLSFGTTPLNCQCSTTPHKALSTLLNADVTDHSHVVKL